MDVFAACVSHVEEPPSASMGVVAGDARKQITNISIWIDVIYVSTYWRAIYTRSPRLYDCRWKATLAAKTKRQQVR